MKGGWPILMVLSGATALGYEAVWLRRLSVVLGGVGVAGAVTIASFLGGLALGAWCAPRLPGTAQRRYAACEAVAACWAIAFPGLLDNALAAAGPLAAARNLVAVLLLVPPAAALGATWATLAPAVGPTQAVTLYAANTAGAVLGVLVTTFFAMPSVGVRDTEVAWALVGLSVAAIATRLPLSGGREPVRNGQVPLRSAVLWASALGGFATLGLELVWFRLAAVSSGSTVQTMGFVLAVFLAMSAAGAALGRRWPADADLGLAGGLVATAALALCGGLLWGQLPYVAAAWWRAFGADGVTYGSLVMAALSMAGAPAASGLAFACAIRLAGPSLARSAGRIYAINAMGSVVGAALAGLVTIPSLEIRGSLWLFAGAAVWGAVIVSRRPWPLAVMVLAAAVPRWDARLFATGVHLRISEFTDPSRAAIRTFADEGWDLLSYDHGHTGAVAVGRSRRTGNVWLSINGKVDASTGDDMPTQLLSGRLPVAASRAPRDVLVVGLASGVTAGAVLADPTVERLTILEIEPAVVDAERFFRHVNGAPLADPRTTLRIDDARVALTWDPTRYDVIVSEPSNPWITGVSSLFTHEYWTLLRARLNDDGVVGQWIQLYGLGPEELQGLLRTFRDVFPRTWVFETVEGSDLLLVGGAPDWRAPPEIPWLLDPAGLARAGGEGWLNTDDHPRVEWGAPRWLHRDTGTPNRALLEAARAP